MSIRILSLSTLAALALTLAGCDQSSSDEPNTIVDRDADGIADDAEDNDDDGEDEPDDSAG